MSDKIDISLKRVITPKFRVSFPAVFKPKSFEGQEPKYSIVMLFDKQEDLTTLKKVVFNAACELWGPKEKHPKMIRLPFRDGNEKLDTPGYKDTVFVSATNKQPPGLVDQKRQPIISEAEFYAGCYARAELIAFAYDKMGNKGVSFSLQNIQKMGDGERFGSRKNAEEIFDNVEDTSEDPSSYGELGSMGF